MKYVPGRKSDVQDCQWLQKLMSLGLLRGAFRPDSEVCVVRAVARQQKALITEQGQWVQRMQKALVEMNIQLTEVLTDVMAVTGQALANWAGVDLTRIPGLGVTVVMTLLTEIGPDLSRFDSVKHFCSWLGLCPGTKISGGKVLYSATKRSANRARQELKMAAQALSHSDS